jgi:hypothetical protein
MQSEPSDPIRPQPLPFPDSASWPCHARSTVYDPDFPAPEPSFVAGAHSFALPFTNSLGRNVMHLAAATKLLALYSIPTELLPFFHCHPSPIPQPILSELLCSCIPFSTAASMVDSVVDALFCTLDHRDSARQSMISILLQHATRPADPLDWTAAYASDPDTCFIIKLLSTDAPWDQPSLNKVSSAYRRFLRDNRMRMMNGKLVAMQPVSNHSQVLALIVAPLSLRRHLFSAYHARPVTGHMKEFKTLHRLRL